MSHKRKDDCETKLQIEERKIIKRERDEEKEQKERNIDDCRACKDELIVR